MKRALHHLLCLLVALQLCGGYLGVAQMIAWTKMVREYSTQRGWIEGVKETFDGEHPCAICSRIAEEKQKEQDQMPLSPEQKLEKIFNTLGLLTSTVTVAKPASILAEGLSFADPVLNVVQRPVSPATPPPRVIVS